jgi:hypothetical protein
VILLLVTSTELKLGFPRYTCNMFIAKLFPRVKICKQPKCASIFEWIKNVLYEMDIIQPL